MKLCHRAHNTVCPQSTHVWIETEMKSHFKGRGKPENEPNLGGFCLNGGVMGCAVSFKGISAEQASVRVSRECSRVREGNLP